MSATHKNDFTDAVQELRTTAEQFARGEIKALPYSRLREDALGKALDSLAKMFDVELEHPLHIDSRGEFRIVTTGSFGGLAELLNRHSPRTGIRPGAVLLPDTNGGWCYMGHFDVERLVFEADAMFEAAMVIESSRKTSNRPNP